MHQDMLDLNTHQLLVLNGMDISLNKIFESQAQNHNETMNELDVIKEKQLAIFDKLFEGQQEILQEQLKEKLKTYEWFEKFDGDQQKIIAELAKGRLNQNHMIQSLKSIHNKVVS